MQRYIIAEINKAIYNNRDFVIIANKNTSIKHDFILKMCKYGFLQSYQYCGNYFILKIKIQHWKNWYTNIRPILEIKQYQPSKSGVVSSSNNRRYNKLKGSSCCSFISTDKGLMTSYSGSNLGGISLFTIY